MDRDRQREAGGRNRLIHRRTTGSWAILVLLLVGALAAIGPFLLAALNAFKLTDDFVAHGPLAWPRGLTIEPLLQFWRYVDFTNKLGNSVLISGSVAVIGVVVSLMAGYAIGIGRIRGRTIVLAVALVGFTLPHEALIYPIYYMFRSVGLYNTQLGVILVLATISATFGIYMLSSILSQFPREILEAAEVDGAGKVRTLWSIVVPIVWPSLAVLATFFFVWTWNDFLVSLALLPSSPNQTVSLSLGILFGQFTTDPVLAAAAALAGIIPSVLFFLVFQRALMRGVTFGAVK